MAISSYPTPSDTGVLCVILANTVISISIIKEIVRSILHASGIRLSSWEEFSIEPIEYRKSPSDSYMDDFRTQLPAKRYDSIFEGRRWLIEQECSICLTEFDPYSDINHLSCGHVFHASCLERWLKLWNSTCPLCRKHMMVPQESEEDDCCPM